MGGKIRREELARWVWCCGGRAVVLLGCAGAIPAACDDDAKKDNVNDPATIAQGKETFRNDTFGDETFWTDMLRMHDGHRDRGRSDDRAVGRAEGRRGRAPARDPGDGRSQRARRPRGAVEDERGGRRQGEVDAGADGDQLTRVGITCALCHSTVDDSVMPGIGKRLDGWPNRDLNPGAIIALSPAITPEQKAVYSSWGPGKYDPRYNIDGMNSPVVIPPAYGLEGSPHATYTRRRRHRVLEQLRRGHADGRPGRRSSTRASA